MKNEVAIITEGEFDASILRKLFKNKRIEANYEIISASGYSSALSKVRSLLTLRNKKIVLLLNSDTIEPVEIKQKADFVNSYLNTNYNKDHFKVVWSIPEFEIIFLNNEKFLDELTNNDKVNKDLLEIGKISPKRTLESISKMGRENFLSLIDKREIREEFFNHGPIKEIYDFIEQKLAVT